jgi:hypothetical protein
MRRLLERVVAEKRSVLLPLGLALVANLLLYAFLVRPLAARSAGAADRAGAAAAALGVAERDLAQAQALVDGKIRADEELSAFYEKVLPSNFAAARRMTYASLPALARRTNVRYDQRNTSVEEVESDSKLGHLTIRVVFRGSYESLRDFIHQLESAPEFVIIDDLVLSGGDDDETHALTLNLSTYFRAGSDGT